MSTQQAKPAAKPAAPAPKKSGGIPAGLILVALFVVALCIYLFIFGNGSHFEGGTNDGHPIPGDYFGIVYKGGPIVPILLTCFLTALTFSIERLFTIGKAKGTGDVNAFVRKVQALLDKDDVEGALKECDKQKGSVGNVTQAAVKKYKQLTTDGSLDKEQKLAALSKEVEEATSLELPMLEKNLTIIATLASVSTLIGLLGTVVGMIKAFSALGNSGGSTDSTALANGISEALINTALGIGTSAICIIAYNFFTSKIDELTYSVDEIGLSVNQNYAAHHN
ncbi:outer membrane transport energization protein ExbB [Pseudarcicella hirudinis]|uniref:Outer membrane transport energization protein ExbB n=1 Tax=Pseudarcicella hirudinis TaxID=1079859 RepID=A0A1I5XNJ4_9BACT|nr:MotA/TolQ/ExbB proton channel family protein [Pseudarcicella hirudinis]SFQ33553.1 outer membrane transport energization protein ExbB [Pseudarcicella hirudinis]